MVDSIISRQEAFVQKTLYIDTSNKLQSETPQFKKLFPNVLQRWRIWWFTKKPVPSADKTTDKDYCLLHIIDRVKSEWKDKYEKSLSSLSFSELRKVSKNLNALQRLALSHNQQMGLSFLSKILGRDTTCNEFNKEIDAVEKALKNVRKKIALDNGNKLIQHFKEINRAQTPELFRIAGSNDDILEIKNRMDDDENMDISEIDVHILSAILKRHVRNLEPFESKKADFLAVMNVPDNEDKIRKLQAMLKEMDPQEQQFIVNLFTMLSFVDANQKGDKAMHASNLAVVFAPNMIDAKTVEESAKMEKVVTFMIENQSTIFTAQAVQ